MKQPNDSRTLEMPGLGEDGQQNRQLGQAPADRPSLALNHYSPGRGRKAGQLCGPYQGAWKIGSDNMKCRIKTGKTQAEFSALCSISERTLRTWESTGNVSTRVGCTIRDKLKALGIDTSPPRRAAGNYRAHVARCRAA